MQLIQAEIKGDPIIYAKEFCLRLVIIPNKFFMYGVLAPLIFLSSKKCINGFNGKSPCLDAIEP